MLFWEIYVILRKDPLPKFPWKSLFTNYIIHNSTLSPAVFAENCLNHTPISMRIFWCAWRPGMSYYMVRFTTSFCFLLKCHPWAIKAPWDPPWDSAGTVSGHGERVHTNYAPWTLAQLYIYIYIYIYIPTIFDILWDPYMRSTVRGTMDCH